MRTKKPRGEASGPLEITLRYSQTIGHLSSVAEAMDGFTARTYEGAHLADIWLSLALLTATILVEFAVAIPRFQFRVAE